MTAAPAVEAQPLSYLNCEELWYERNAIYARNGYCFKTARAQQAFGRGCFPPYGRLSGWEKERVARIEQWEYRKGCR
ncbi:MAG: YARHG domain-containing protein [Gammaproteobacteria bacterium]|nr:YARHG domain-containing protein [Gammaproteobacteria bacterium]MBU1960045.1 YARHG domain-containing protein [Gammaproteobacteria bacterium]